MQRVDRLETDESQRDTLPLRQLLLRQFKLLDSFPFGEVVEPDRRAVD